MFTWTTGILALFVIIVFCFVGNFVRKTMDEQKRYEERRKQKLMENKSTHFLDKKVVDDTCDICFGEVSEGRVAVCKCGMKFHEDCAEATEECPYCKTKFEDMQIRDIIRPQCPACGAVIKKNVCPECWTVLPNRDMTFECVCGEPMTVGLRVCGACGAKYGFTYEKPAKVDKRRTDEEDR